MNASLKTLTVRQLALLDDVQARFEPGLNVITGATGSGKTLLLDGLRLALGRRADYDMVSDESARISASFNVRPEQTPEGYPQNETLIARRILQPSKNSRSLLNDEPAPLKTLRTLRDQLVDFHGQHENQVVFQSDYPLKTLDRFGDYQEQLNDYRETYSEYDEARTELAELKEKKEEQDKLQLLQYQLDEIEEFAPEEGEWEDIEERRTKLEAHEEIQQSLRDLTGLLGSTAQDLPGQIDEAKAKAEQLSDVLGEEWEEWVDELIAMHEQLRTFRDFARSEQRSQDYSEQEYNELMRRRKEWTELARKHDVRPNELYQHYEALRDKRSTFENYQQRKKELQQTIDQLHDTLLDKGEALHKQRAKAAAELEQRIMDHLGELNLGGSVFRIELGQRDEPGPDGRSNVDWKFASHESQDTGPFSDRVSGGEISRVLLALKSALADADATPILVFDEIDTGISGEEADQVGQMLKELSEHHQIICITHLPIIAAYGDHHVRIDRTDEQDVRVDATMLDRDGRIDELSRLLSGEDEAEVSQKQARDLLDKRNQRPS